jgi:hypothetical protein
MKNFWSQSELIRVLCAYAALDEIGRRRPPREVIDALQQNMPIRSVKSIEMRFANFVARDNSQLSLGFKGLSGGGEHVDALWDRFITDGLLDQKKLLMAAALEIVE